jgi:hypothetical protein
MQALINFTVLYNAGPVEFYRDTKMWSARQDARTTENCRTRMEGSAWI